MPPAVVLFFVLVAADIALWVMAIVAPLSSTGRFRAYAFAILLLVLLGGVQFGWAWTLTVGAFVAWIAAIGAASWGPKGAGQG